MDILMDSAITDKIEEALKQIRPYLEKDGGDVSLVEVTTDYVAKVKLHGSCSSCNMSMMTLKSGIEEAIKRAVPEIVSVEAINLTSSLSLP